MVLTGPSVHLHLSLSTACVHLIDRLAGRVYCATWARHTATMIFCLRLSSSISSWYALAVMVTTVGGSWSGELLRGLSLGSERASSEASWLLNEDMVSDSLTRGWEGSSSSSEELELP